MDPSETDALSDEISALAQVHIKTVQELTGAELDYSGGSLYFIDGIIDEWWPDKPPGDLDRVVLQFGAYVGETIRLSFGGKWGADEIGWRLSGIGGRDVTTYPINKTAKRFKNGMEESLLYYFQSIQTMLAKAALMQE